MNTKFDIGQRVTYTVRHEAKIDGIQIKGDGTVQYSIGGRMIAERDLNGADMEKGKPADISDPIKLYCVKSYGSLYKRGNLYETDIDGYMRQEGGMYLCRYTSTDSFFTAHPQLKDCLFPLVKRPAKVGEWVYIVRSNDSRALVGGIYEVALHSREGSLFVKHPLGRRVGDGAACIGNSAYLVLDGYHGEAES